MVKLAQRIVNLQKTQAKSAKMNPSLDLKSLIWNTQFPPNFYIECVNVHCKFIIIIDNIFCQIAASVIQLLSMQVVTNLKKHFCNFKRATF